MLQLIQRILLWFRGGTLNLLLLAGLILLAWGVFAPVGTLIWWLSQDSESLNLRRSRSHSLPSDENSHSVTQSSEINCYVVFLTGVGDFSANQLAPGEEIFVDRLVEQHPNCVAVRDVFPYSAANESLGGRRLLAPLWRAAEEASGWLENADILIKIRNLWRFAISVDSRYGPVYNEGIAIAIVDRMNAAQPMSNSQDSPLKLILIGTSGGAQVALGAAPYLNSWLDVELIVVSIGGDFAGTNGFKAADHIYHLQGRRDWIEDISRMIFPGRWPWTIGSPFNQARQQGRYTVLVSGPHGHDGSTGYFGRDSVGNNGTTYVDLTLQKVNQLPIWSNQK
ncbi:hypothetical protein [Lyngbya aestuarii]|uniref:hypothetical protein n=1 Tax=Lyngbya aestuarii TaxID=118322 RepID=UPI00403DE309